MRNDLVFDIGLHRGDDARYYLDLGYRVVGVEANPLLARHCALRFAEEVRQGRMTIVNAGVLKQTGVFKFYRNLIDDGWSSFEPQRIENGKWEDLEVPCVTTKQLITVHGKPFFMKVDIEGADLETLDPLSRSDCPDYVSLELNVTDGIVERLIELGYSAFKFVHGETYWSTPPIFDHQVGWRILRKLGRAVPSFRCAIQKLPQRLRAKSEWNPTEKYSPDHYPFTANSSGPFGEQAAGSWITSAAARRKFEALRHDYRRAGEERFFWWDVHARHSSTGRN